MKFLLLALLLGLVPAGAQAAGYKYSCFGFGDSKGARFTIRVYEKTLRIEEMGVAKRNLKFRPGPRERHFIEYTKGPEDRPLRFLVEREMLTGGHPMKNGGKGGILKFRWWEPMGWRDLLLACFNK